MLKLLNFFTRAIPFNAIKNPTFLKMCEMIGKYGPGYRPPSYHDVREKLLKMMKVQENVTCSYPKFTKEFQILSFFERISNPNI